MPVDVGAHREVVQHPDLDVVTSIELDLWSGHDAVVGPCLDEHAGFHLPVDDLGFQVEDLGAVGQDLGRLEDRVALPVGLGRKGEHRVHHRLVERPPFLLGEVAVVAVADGSTRGNHGVAVAGDGQGCDHAGGFVAGDLAEQRVFAGLEFAERQADRAAGAEVRCEIAGLLHAEVVVHRAVVVDEERHVARRCHEVPRDRELLEIHVDRGRDRGVASAVAGRDGDRRHGRDRGGDDEQRAEAELQEEVHRGAVVFGHQNSCRSDQVSSLNVRTGQVGT